MPAESYIIFCYSIRGGQIQGDTNIACRIRDYNSGYYFFIGVYLICPPLLITNHNQLWYINSKKIFKGQKNKVPKTTGRWYMAFLPGFTGTDLSCPPPCRKKRIETSGLSLSDCNVISKMPVQYHQRLWREFCDDIGNFTLHTIPSDEVSCNFLCYLFRIGWVNGTHQYFSL